MTEKIKYKCASCGKFHEGWPALAFNAPTAYDVLSESWKEKIGELSTDFCIVRHPEQTDRFIRCTFTLKVVDDCQTLEYGIWVSLSEKSFEDYKANYGNADFETKYFGWFSNDIPEYDNFENIPTTVFTRLNNKRPEIVPHEGTDHPLVKDYYNGITKAEAEKRIKDMLSVVDKKDGNVNLTKPWWKFWQ